MTRAPRQQRVTKAAMDSTGAVLPRTTQIRRHDPGFMVGQARHDARVRGGELLLPGVAGVCRCGRPVQGLLAADVSDPLLAVVDALLSEQTDEAASRSLGMSPRTFSRRVAELLEHLNVATRFQGGAELVRRARLCHCLNEGRPRP